MRKILFLAVIVSLNFTACKISSSITIKNPKDSVIIVDHNQTIDDLIARGDYSWFDNQTINSANFPTAIGKVNSQETLNIKLFYFDKSLSLEEIVLIMNQAGFRPATLMELLAFGSQYPEAQKQYPVLAPGSLWRGYGGLPYLNFDSGRRSLSLNWNHYEWPADCRFLAVKIIFYGNSGR